jgi:hypothetical protein
MIFAETEAWGFAFKDLYQFDLCFLCILRKWMVLVYQAIYTVEAVGMNWMWNPPGIWGLLSKTVKVVHLGF